MLYTLTITFTGRSEARAIEASGDQKNLWMARWAGIGAAVFTLINIAMIVAIFMSDDAGSRAIL